MIDGMNWQMRRLAFVFIGVQKLKIINAPIPKRRVGQDKSARL